MKNVTKFWFLKDFNLFKKMGQGNLMALSGMLEMINVKKGEELFLDRSDTKVVYFVKMGAVKIVNKNNSHTLSILSVGSIFGELSIYPGEQTALNEEKAVVLEDGVVCLVETEQMRMMLDKYSSLKNQLIKLQGLRIRRLQRNLEDLLYKDSQTRICEYVIKYIKDFGKEKDGVFKAKNLLSHQDIAHLTNTSRQTVSNVMSKLRKQGVIDYNSKEILIV